MLSVTSACHPNAWRKECELQAVKGSIDSDSEERQIELTARALRRVESFNLLADLVVDRPAAILSLPLLAA